MVNAMSDIAISTMDLAAREALLQSFPCFSALTAAQREQLAQLMQERSIDTGTQIVAEEELVDSIYIIISGEAEVTRRVKKLKKIKQVPFAILGAAEGIGFNDTGFYSSTGKRTATVTAMTPMRLLRLDLNDLHQFLKENDLEHVMYAASLQMQRMRFIKQSLPFSKISAERLQWLANHVVTLSVPAGTLLFRQGEKGDKCYLIRSGQIEIFTTDEHAIERQIAILKPPVLFGEATLVTGSPRNASARALVDCELLVLPHQDLQELIESEQNVAKMFVTLMIDRSRPLRNAHVTVHTRHSADGQPIVILKNPEQRNYFKLSQEGAYIWQQLDGQHTLQEITLSLAEKYNVFAPDVVAALISKLTRAGYISNIEIDPAHHSAMPVWVRALMWVRNLLELRVAIGDADPWISRIYKKYIHYLFTLPSQLVLAVIAIIGIAAFITTTQQVLTFFSTKHTGLLLILGLLPLSAVAILLHELGHAFTVKAFEREVHYLGIGWYWVAPIAFTDTSDMWLANRKQRMIVNIAGVYVDMLVAGVSSLLILCMPNPYLQAMLWLFALYTYIGGLRNLSPIQDMDGYYILMDGLEKPQLRKFSVLWLLKTLPKSLRHPALFKKHKAEMIYWACCLLYLIVVSGLTLIVQEFVFKVLGMSAVNPYLSLVLPFLVVLFSSFSMIADIRSQAED